MGCSPSEYRARAFAPVVLLRDESVQFVGASRPWNELALQRPALLHDLMKRWQGALDEADEWLTEMSAGSARWRMLRLLLKLSEFNGPDGLVWLPTRQEMGAMLDMTVETASRLVSALKREGVIDTPDARHLRIDMPALMAALRSPNAG